MFVGSEVSDKIWVPDTFFANEKWAQFHQATTFNTFIRIRANGDVLRSIRLTVTSSCPMNLQYFPMDRQSCTIEVESCEYIYLFFFLTFSDDDNDDRGYDFQEHSIMNSTEKK